MVIKSRRARTLGVGVSRSLFFSEFRECVDEEEGGISTKWKKPVYRFFKSRSNWRLLLTISIKLKDGKYLRVTFIVGSGCPHGLEVCREIYDILFKNLNVNEIIFGDKKFIFHLVDKSLEPVNLIGLEIIGEFGFFVCRDHFMLFDFPLYLNSLNAPRISHTVQIELVQKIMENNKFLASASTSAASDSPSTSSVSSSSASASSSFTSTDNSTDIADSDSVLFLCNLPSDIRSDQIFDILKNDGVSSVYLIRNEKGSSKGMCYAEFNNAETAQARLKKELRIRGRIIQMETKTLVLQEGFPDPKNWLQAACGWLGELVTYIWSKVW